MFISLSHTHLHSLRLSFSLTPFLFLSLLLCLSVSLHFSLSLSLSLCLSLYLSLSCCFIENYTGSHEFDEDNADNREDIMSLIHTLGEMLMERELEGDRAAWIDSVYKVSML